MTGSTLNTDNLNNRKAFAIVEKALDLPNTSEPSFSICFEALRNEHIKAQAGIKTKDAQLMDSNFSSIVRTVNDPDADYEIRSLACILVNDLAGSGNFLMEAGNSYKSFADIYDLKSNNKEQSFLDMTLATLNEGVDKTKNLVPSGIPTKFNFNRSRQPQLFNHAFMTTALLQVGFNTCLQHKKTDQALKFGEMSMELVEALSFHPNAMLDFKDEIHLLTGIAVESSIVTGSPISNLFLVKNN